MTHLRLTKHVQLPCLSWCARFKPGERSAEVQHGALIEVDAETFSEGAWSSDFSKKDFSNALVFTGSGGRITEQGIMFSTATHTLAPIYLLASDSGFIVSNSLAFLLTQANDELDLNYKFYANDLMSITEGLDKYVTTIRTKNSNAVQLFYHCNFEISRDGKITKREKVLPPAFQNYQDYDSFLRNQIGALVKNAKDSARKAQYEPITTVSSGYDSCAASALAIAFGCKRALTLKTSRSGENDSGKEIGELLGMKVIEYERDDYRQRNDGSEIEFLAIGTGGEDMVMAPMGEAITGKLLFTGFHGDKVWARANYKISPNIIRGDTSGSSLEEFRLRLGFFNLPVPFIGCVRHSDLHRISNSAEMKPWSVANSDYDRPIARRLIQEAGVPGHLFGQKKKTASTPFDFTDRNEDAEENLSVDALRDFAEFAKGRQLFQSPWERIYLALLPPLSQLNQSILKRCQKRGFFSNTSPLISQKFRKRVSKNHLIFPWAMNKIKKRYMFVR